MKCLQRVAGVSGESTCEKCGLFTMLLKLKLLEFNKLVN